MSDISESTHAEVLAEELDTIHAAIDSLLDQLSRIEDDADEGTVASLAGRLADKYRSALRWTDAYAG